MPLRISNTTTDISVLNRWAEEIESKLNKASTAAHSALVAVNPASGTSTLAANFGLLTTGDNTKAIMTVDTGASLSYVGSGVVNANKVGGIAVNGNTPTHTGQLLISQPGNATAVWADPLVQGLNSPGTSGTSLNPVVVGGLTASGLVQTLLTDGLGNLNVAIQNEPIVTISDIDGNPVVTDGAVQVNFQQPIAIQDSSGQPLGSTLGALNVFVENAAASSGNPAAGATGAAVPASADYTGFNSGGNLVGVSAVNPLPITGSLSFTDPAEGSTGGGLPSQSIQIGGSDGAALRAIATDSSGQVKVLVQNTPAVTLASTTITGTVAATQSTSPWVDNVTQFGSNPVVTGTGASGVGIPRVTVSSDSFPATQPISAVSLPLPSNAAQEANGNLAAILTQRTLVATQTRNDSQIIDVLNSILAQLKLLNMNLASSMPSAYIDQDSYLLDSIPTIQ